MYVKHTARVLNPSAILDAAVSRARATDREAVDRFWEHKNEAYRYIINSRVGVLADYACQAYMRQNIAKMSSDDYYVSEEVLAKKVPGLIPLLTGSNFGRAVWHMTSEPIQFTERTFFIDDRYSFFWSRIVSATAKAVN